MAGDEHRHFSGVAAGALVGWALSATLVTVLTGVSNPPPTASRCHGPYLVLAAARSTARPAVALPAACAPCPGS